ncbi:unnamed protein product [Rhizophagus irregularis]|nr:unnamed protein product [Rhizophagus irregularis]
MRLKNLESELQVVAGFDKPKIQLEQYCTTPHLCSSSQVVLRNSENSIAANLLDSNYNLALDIDNDALQIAKENCSEFEVDVEFYSRKTLFSTSTDHLQNKVDTIIATTSVYSLHKSSTREYIREKAKNWGVECEVLAEMKFDIPMMYKFIKKSGRY